MSYTIMCIRVACSARVPSMYGCIIICLRLSMLAVEFTSFSSYACVAEVCLGRGSITNGDDVTIFTFTTLLTVAATTKLESFAGGDVAEYLERLEFYFVVNSIGAIAANASQAEKIGRRK